MTPMPLFERKAHAESQLSCPRDKTLLQKIILRRVSLEPSGFGCPGCGGECLKGHVDDVEVDTCVACHGVWLDAGELVEASRGSREQRLVASQDAGFRAFLSTL